MKAEKLVRFVTYLLLGLMLYPKINVYEIAGSRAGIRIEDFAILLGCGYFGFRLVSVGNLSWLTFNRYWYILAGFTFVLSFIEGNPLFPLRMVEYACLTILGYWAGRDKLYNLIKLFLLVNGVLMSFQLLGWIGGMTLGGYSDLGGSRIVGVCNGPWEMGMVLNVAFAYVGSVSLEKRRRFNWVTLVVSACVVWTSARLSLGVHILLVSYFVWRQTRLRDYSALIGIGAVFFGVAIAFVVSDTFASGFTQRLQFYKDYSSISYMSDLIGNFSPTEQAGWDSTMNETYTKYNVDPSMMQRYFTAQYMLGVYKNAGLFQQFVGKGLGFFGPSTDLGWLRLLVEGGIISVGIFLLGLLDWFRITKTTALVTVTVALNMLLLDAFLSYKNMLFVFVILGSEYLYKSRMTGTVRLHTPSLDRVVGTSS